MFLIAKKMSVDKSLTLRSISLYDSVLFQFTTARLITNYNNILLQITIAWLLQFSTTVITLYDRYYNLQWLILQFTTGITIHDIITIHNRTNVPLFIGLQNSEQNQSMANSEKAFMW